MPHEYQVSYIRSYFRLFHNHIQIHRCQWTKVSFSSKCVTFMTSSQVFWLWVRGVSFWSQSMDGLMAQILVYLPTAMQVSGRYFLIILISIHQQRARDANLACGLLQSCVHSLRQLGAICVKLSKSFGWRFSFENVFLWGGHFLYFFFSF